MKKMFLAFMIGQLLQLALHATCLNYFPYQQVPVCIAAGAMVAITLVVGVTVAKRETRITKEEIAPPIVVSPRFTYSRGTFTSPIIGEGVYED